MDVSTIEASLVEFLTGFLPKVVGVILLLVVAWTVAGWIGRRIRQSISRRLDPTIASFFGSLAKYGILVMAILSCLQMFGVGTTSFAAVIGAAGLAIGLAMQGTLGNFSAGIMLLAFRPFKVGDVVNIGGVTGKVVEIAMFSTEIDTFDNRRFTVPNGSVYGSTIENMTFHDTRRVDVAVGTDYPASIADARKVLITAASSVNGILADPAPVAILTELGASSIDWSVRVWSKTSDYWAVKEELTQKVKEHLDEAGIGIPFPQMDVHIDGKIDR
ncbi:MAG: mechanosensitive ion channel [Rhodothermales bacterium]